MVCGAGRKRRALGAPKTVASIRGRTCLSNGARAALRRPCGSGERGCSGSHLARASSLFSHLERASSLVGDARAREGRARRPWEQRVVDHQPPNLFLVAKGENGVAAYAAVRPGGVEMFLLFVAQPWREPRIATIRTGGT